jgi:hypothetical protein
MADRPTLTVAVVMRRERLTGAAATWLAWRWSLADVVLQDPLGLPDGLSTPFRLETEPDRAGLAETAPDADVAVDVAADVAGNGSEATEDAYWMFPGFKVELFRDDGEGLYLNLTTPRPCFWVLWRHESESDPATLPQPQVVTLSYHDAGRWLDAQERVDQVPAPATVIDWLRAFVTEHYLPEPKRRRRPQSFKPLTDRFGNPASIATGKNRGSGEQRGE